MNPIAKQRKLDGVKGITTILERETPRKKSLLYTIRAHKKAILHLCRTFCNQNVITWTDTVLKGAFTYAKPAGGRKHNHFFVYF